MRVDQIITLVWAANVALLGGVGWVGWQCWETKKAGAPDLTCEWPEGVVAEPPSRWPGDVSGFRHIWDTPFNGVVPPPPRKETDAPVVKVDPATAFRNRYTIEAGIPATSARARMLMLKDGQGGRSFAVSPGELVDDAWQLISVDVSMKTGAVSAKFRNPNYEKGDLTLEQVVPTLAPLTEKAPKPFTPGYGDLVNQGAATRTRVTVQAWFDDVSQTWEVPAEEAEWWAAWGQADVLDKTKLVARPQGVEVASMPPRAALNGTRGIVQGDVIVSINGVEVRAPADITGYLRGDGAGLSRYVVVIERDGSRRTQVYNVARRNRDARRS